ncbi:MAG: GNAT family N-acetyltransferase [Actinobacteria bacterium]|nr:GNAT family N-acetyltransferase [Actinomycetota bacterium]
MTITVSTEDPRNPDMAKILQTHLDFCRAVTPVGFSFALDLSKLVSPDITVFGARIDGELVGVGAIRILDKEHAELKSMHTLANYRGNGVGSAMVDHITAYAKEKGMKRLSLETGAKESYKAARDLYEKMGFTYCDAFGDYTLGLWSPQVSGLDSTHDLSRTSSQTHGMGESKSLFGSGKSS